MFVELLLIFLALGLGVWKYISIKNDYFKGRNCKHDYYFPILGSMRSAVFKKKSVLDVLIEIYNKAEGNK